MSAAKILFVCTGNICRSPTAEGVFRAVVEKAGLSSLYATDSAGTHGYHVGDPPDPRSCAAAAVRGYDIGGLRARRLERLDFETFDLMLAMDRGHLQIMKEKAPRDARVRLSLFMDYAPGSQGRDVPDPYYGGLQDFEKVLDMVEQGVEGLLSFLQREKI